MRRLSRCGIALAGFAALAMALGLPQLAASGATSAVSAKTSQSEAIAIKKVKWTSNVATAVHASTWTFTSDGLPASEFVATNYAVPANAFDVTASGASVMASAQVLQDQNYSYTLPLKPRYSATTTVTNQGPIGVMLDGAAIYNPYEANHATIATSDNFVATANGLTGSFLDSCDGHPGPGGQYHYHGLPSCLTTYASGGSPKVTSVTSTAGTTTTGVTEDNAISKKPIILGFAFDGYGIYDNVAMNGKTIPVSALDACNGIFSPVPGYAKGVYHYVLENVKGARSSIGCYHGVVSSAYTKALLAVLNTNGFNESADVAHVGSPATLYANRGEDTFLRDMISLRGLNDYC